MNINIEIKKSWFIAIFVLLLVGVVYAAVDKSMPWHSSSQVEMSDGDDLETAFSGLETDFDNLNQKFTDNKLDKLKLIQCIETIVLLDWLGDDEGCKIRVDCDDGTSKIVWNQINGNEYRNTIEQASENCWQDMQVTSDTLPILDPTYLGSTGIINTSVQYNEGMGRRIYYLSSFNS